MRCIGSTQGCSVRPSAVPSAAGPTRAGAPDWHRKRHRQNSAARSLGRAAAAELHRHQQHRSAHQERGDNFASMRRLRLRSDTFASQTLETRAVAGFWPTGRHHHWRSVRFSLTTVTNLLRSTDFAAPDYRVLMQRWLASVPVHGALLFCHPGRRDTAAPPRADPIGAAREREAAYLGSTAFSDDLAAAGVRLGSAWPLA